MVPQSKIVGEKDPSAGQMVKVIQGQVYSEEVVAIGGGGDDLENPLSEMKEVKNATNKTQDETKLIQCINYLHVLGWNMHVCFYNHMQI